MSRRVTVNFPIWQTRRVTDQTGYHIDVLNTEHMSKPQSQVLRFSVSVGISKLAGRYSFPLAAAFACFYLVAFAWYVVNGGRTQLRYAITFSCLGESFLKFY